MVIKNQEKVILLELYSFPTIKEVRHQGKRNNKMEFLYVFTQVATRGFCVTKIKNLFFLTAKDLDQACPSLL